MVSRISRRRFLALGGSALVSALLGAGRAGDGHPQPPRVGAVLPADAEVTPLSAAGEAILRGATLAREEAASTGRDVLLRVATAPDRGTARRAAERLIHADGAVALVGGVGNEQATALSEVAARSGVPFLNVGATGNELRDAEEFPCTFHVEASTTHYLAAIANWFAGQGHRRWLVVRGEGAEADTLYRQSRIALERPFVGVGQLDEMIVRTGQRSHHHTLAAVREAEPDVVLVLLDAAAQLDLLGQAEADPPTAIFTGFPHPVCQSRAFHAALQHLAPRAGVGPRAVRWHPALDPAGLAARYFARWGVPVDAPAWAGYEAMAILDRAIGETASGEGIDLVSWFAGESLASDRSSPFGRDRHLDLPLAMVRLDPEASGSGPLTELVATMP